MVIVGKLLNEATVTEIDWGTFQAQLVGNSQALKIRLRKLEIFGMGSTAFNVQMAGNVTLDFRGKTVFFCKDRENVVGFGESEVAKIEFVKEAGCSYYSVTLKSKLICRIIV
jgi:hypothetical protein